jgi:hypothetical protein
MSSVVVARASFVGRFHATRLDRMGASDREGEDEVFWTNRFVVCCTAGCEGRWGVMMFGGGCCRC